MIGRYPFQNKRSKGLPSYLPKLDFIENILKFNCYMSQALFFWFLKCTVVMFFIKLIISLKVFQTYIKVGIQIFESLLENVMTKKDSWFMSTKRLYTKVEIQIFWNSLFCPITSINGTYNTYIHDRSCSELCTGFYGKNGGAKLVLLTSIFPLSATNRCYYNQYMLYHRMYNTWCGN